MRFFLRRLLPGLVIVAAAVLIFLLWPERPDLDAYSALNEQYDVEILRDTYGVPHVFGVSDTDTAFGLAFAHAEDDFLTIQQSLVAARGDLAYVYGADAAPNDFMVQLLRIEEVVDAGYERDLSPETRALVEAYADGLNYYASLHEDEALPGAFPVTGRDVVAGFVHKTPLFFGIDSVLGELFAEERQKPVTTRTAAGDAAPARGLRLPLPLRTFHGSNVVAVGPSRTANGETFLAVNSHQPWQGPVTWYEAHLHSDDGWDMVGGLFPGAPLILHGHNRDLGWGFTVNAPDLVDVYVLEINPENPDQYRFDGEWRELEVRQAPITVKLFGRFRWTVTREVLWSVYGPTVRQPHGTYALRFAGYGEVTLIEQWYRMNRAATLQQWRSAMADGPLPMFNAGYADREGNVHYVYNARLPLRAPGYDWELYLPGDTSETLWTDILPFDQLPQVTNPPAGFIINTNASPFAATSGAGNPDPANYPATFGVETYANNRSLRALELFTADPSITEAEFAAYKYDSCYVPESDPLRVAHMVVEERPYDDPTASAAANVLAGWDGCMEADSRAATVAWLTYHYLGQQEGADLSGAGLLNGAFTPSQVAAAFGQTADHLETHFDGEPVPLSQFARLRRGDLDLGLEGGPDVLGALYGELERDGRLRANNGDGYVLLVTWDASGNVSSRSVHQYGSATLDEESPHYNDQSPLFAARELKPVWMDEAEIRANLERAYRP